MVNEMDRLTDLGEAISPAEIPLDRLHAKAFQPNARPRRMRPALITAAAVAAAVTAAGVILWSGSPEPAGQQAATPSGTTPPQVRPASFKVIKNGDGSVTLTVHDLLDLAGATRALNDAGIAGRVLTSTPDCTTGPNVVPINPADLHPPDTAGRKGHLSGSDTVVFQTSDYPPGGGLLVNVSGDIRRDNNNNAVHLIVSYLAYVDVTKIPTCVNFVDPGTGPLRPYPPR